MVNTSPSEMAEEIKGAYAVITADIIGSAALARATGNPVTPLLKQALQAVNLRHKSVLAVPFSITIGDECQALIKDIASSPEILYDLRVEMAPVRLRGGIGVGGISTKIQNTTREMEGDCFLRAREALENLSGPFITGVRMGDGAAENAAASMLQLVDALQSGWRKSQWATVRAIRDAQNNAAAARELGVSPAAMSQRLSSTKWPAIRRALETLGDLLKYAAPD